MKKEITREDLNKAVQAYLNKGGKITRLEHSLSLNDELYAMELESDSQDKREVEVLTGENFYPDQQMSIFAN